MKTSYSLLIFCLCLNLAAWGINESALFQGSSYITTFDPETELAKMNATEQTDILLNIPGGQEIAMVIGFFKTVGNLFIGFPTFVASIPFVPDYLVIIIDFLFIFVYIMFLVELASNRNITGDFG